MMSVARSIAWVLACAGACAVGACSGGGSTAAAGGAGAGAGGVVPGTPVTVATAAPSSPPGAGTTSPSPAPTATPVPALPTAGPASSARFAPYADMSAWPPFQLGAAAQSTGTRIYTLAFVVSDGGCRGAWGGTVLPGDATYGPYYAQQLAAIRAAGGDGIVSFGGENGRELAQACTDAPSTAAAYETIVDTYGFTRIDFDIEGAAVADPASIARRSQALVLVQQHYAALGKALTVSFTLPVLPTGLDANGMNVVRAAVSAGVRLSLVNVMAMDYGDWAAPNPQGQMGAYAIQAAQSTAAQLATFYPGSSDAQRYAMVGVTPMIGVNDTSDEVFGLADAAQLLAFARQAGLGRIAFWSATRDVQCSGGATAYASSTCSGVVQSAGAFEQLFAGY